MKLPNIISNEPAAISGAFAAVLNALILFGVAHLTAEQLAGVNAALASVLALWVRKMVTPK